MFDVTYAIRQLSIVTALATSPIWLFGWFRSRRLLLFLILPATVLADVLFVLQTLTSSAGVWGLDPPPYTPLRIGPSYLSLFEIGWGLLFTLWLPFSALWVGVRLWRRWRKAQPSRNPTTALVVSCYLVVATFVTSVTLGIIEYDHEDTVFASGFSLTKWNTIRLGMSRTSEGWA